MRSIAQWAFFLRSQGLRHVALLHQCSEITPPGARRTSAPPQHQKNESNDCNDDASVEQLVLPRDLRRVEHVVEHRFKSRGVDAARGLVKRGW
jgi:hypothetical protein